MRKSSFLSESYYNFFLYFLNYSCIIWLFTSCAQHKEVAIDPKKPVFDTQESTKLFFRNMRQSYYDVEEMKPAKIEVFRIGERSEDPMAAVIPVKIIHQWANDKAYAMVEANEFLNGMDTLTVVWKDSTQQAGEYIFPMASPQPKHFEFASNIYRSIQSGHQMSLKVAGEEKELFSTRESREPFRKTMVDFYRLVGLL